MGIETVAFIFGGILLLIGILGGGFELKELKVPKVTLGPRLLASVVGLIFVGVGIGMMGGDTKSGSEANKPDVQSQTSPIEFMINDHIGENQVSEQVTVILDGKNVGNLTVNEHYPNSKLMVTVPRRGQYSYSIDVRAVFRSGEELVEYAGVGQGMINVEPKKNYDVQGTISGNTWLVTLVETEKQQED
jgi:hypothetical protein